jgi:hypothetical protein
MAQRINPLKQADLKRTKPALLCNGTGLYLRTAEGTFVTSVARKVSSAGGRGNPRLA